MSTVSRLKFGLIAGDFQFKTSRPGIDVETAAGPEHLSFDIEWLDLVQIWAAGTAYVDSGLGMGYMTGAYWRLATFSSQGFIPFVLVWAAGKSAPPMHTRYLLVNETSVWVGYDVWDFFPYSPGAPGTLFKYAVFKFPVTS